MPHSRALSASLSLGTPRLFPPISAVGLFQRDIDETSAPLSKREINRRRPLPHDYTLENTDRRCLSSFAAGAHQPLVAPDPSSSLLIPGKASPELLGGFGALKSCSARAREAARLFTRRVAGGKGRQQRLPGSAGSGRVLANQATHVRCTYCRSAEDRGEGNQTGEGEKENDTSCPCVDGKASSPGLSRDGRVSIIHTLNLPSDSPRPPVPKRFQARSKLNPPSRGRYPGQSYLMGF
ncbi:hypothetical protein ACOMHN_031580 [Nucella lapillus]